MSRRWESRESDSKRYRFKFDGDPSPKRSRRDGKPATERPSSNLHSEGDGRSDRDPKQNQRLRDALPLEAPPAPDLKIETGTKSKESEKKISEQPEVIKKSYSNPADAQRPRSYLQHDERDRRQIRGAPTERGSWRDSKNQRSEKSSEKIEPRSSIKKDNQRDDNQSWRHDGFYKMERDQQSSGRKRPAFRERKDEVAPQRTEKTKADPVNKGEERKGERGKFLERERYGGGRGREFIGRRGYQPGGGVRVEKWKHDMYEEANRSPTPKNEEDHIAKVEALLAL